jgi:adenylate cyclase
MSAPVHASAMSTNLNTENKVIMSADIVGSTAIYEAVGDALAQQIVAECLTIVKSDCSEHKGHVVAEVGDELIAMFSDPTEAASAASDIHVHLNEEYKDDDERNIRMRVGLHYGPVPAGGQLLMSETTKIAKWAADNAKPEQTLATAVLINELPRLYRAVARYVDDETWNFVSVEHFELYEIIWDVESITAYAGEKPVRDAQSYDTVEFSYGGASVVLSATRPVISVGRGSQNDLVVKKDLVSRQHLRAQFSRGRCTITDNSTNGSVVINDNGERYELKRDSFRLSGSGIIIPGHPEHEEVDFEISFRCE